MTLLLFSIEIYPLGKNVNALLELISNSSIKIEYFFFMEGKKAFLVKSNQDGTYKVWHYTNDRQWQPIHNAKEIDGLKEASKNISTISRDLQSETITFGSIIVNSIDDSILNLLKKIENKTITIAGYFWSNKHYDFAFSNKGEARIWNYRYNKKWRPLHNISMVLNMSYMFAYAQSFNQDLTKWKMHDKVNTKSMFLNSKSIDEANKPKGISK